jgi:hypothetical protein
VEAEQVLAFRLARSGLAVRGAHGPGRSGLAVRGAHGPGRSGLAVRGAHGLAEAAACPASDFVRDAALLALAARVEGVSREAYLGAVDSGDLVVAHIVRGAIHALAPGDLPLYGRALIARDDRELGVQLGRQVQRLAAETGFAVGEALDEVAAATEDALAGGATLDRNELHEELRRRVRPEVMPWCRSCASHTSRRCCGSTRP